ncbi:MAG: endopeptidase La [Candidatus Alcyoniella australis]|nr:endopeptidase La [Candidatus Alcyoniella australis]
MSEFDTDNNEPQASGARKLLPLLPLRDIVVFPFMVVPLFVGRDKSIAALEEAMGKDKEILLCAQQDAKIDEPAEADIYRVGTIGNIIQMLRLPDGTVKVLIEGRARARIREYIPNEEFFLVYCEQLDDGVGDAVETAALVRSVHATFETYVKLNKRIPADMVNNIQSIEEASRLADTLVAHLSNLKIEEKQAVIETIDATERLEKIFGHMRAEIEILQVERKIKSRVRKQMERTQKEYYLNEQMRAIQKELGERDEFKSELRELEELLAKKKLSAEATTKVKSEIKKLKMMSPMSAEATVVRNYIDTILSLPWDDKTEDKIELREAERILDEDHFGLKRVKERIVEYLAVQKLVGKIKGPILCLVGPPGVGKTSLGKSVARATGRKFVRLSLGGVRDEAEIRGHRRTYIGALPGKIIQSLRKAGSNNPVFLLDEVDKMSSDFRGDPASALLEVLDSEQNHVFNDHYLDLDYDLSEVMFITTANVLHHIPAPLQDRMEIIRLAGYTEQEQFQIARRHLMAKQLEAHGLNDERLQISDSALMMIIRNYIREAGVRNFEREIASICRKVAKEVVRDEITRPIRITARNLSRYLGIPRFRYGQIEEKDLVGLTNGLAWTEVGGELLATEVSVMPGKGRLTITGSLGDVMQESAQAAMSYVRSRAEALKLDPKFYQRVDLHVHVGEGAIPKDGPSAGITMATSIASALTRIPVKRDVAMTGEITLRGRILPIGGLKEKVLAAHRGQIRTVILPRENEKDLKEVPSSVLKQLRLVLVENMDDVLREALQLAQPDELFSHEPTEHHDEQLQAPEYREVRGPLS